VTGVQTCALPICFGHAHADRMRFYQDFTRAGFGRGQFDVLENFRRAGFGDLNCFHEVAFISKRTAMAALAITAMS